YMIYIIVHVILPPLDDFSKVSLIRVNSSLFVFEHVDIPFFKPISHKTSPRSVDTIGHVSRFRFGIFSSIIISFIFLRPLSPFQDIRSPSRLVRICKGKSSVPTVHMYVYYLLFFVDSYIVPEVLSHLATLTAQEHTTPYD